MDHNDRLKLIQGLNDRLLYLPEDKRKAALESIEFGKQWEQMYKDLGID